MIDYHTFCQLRVLRDERGLSIRQICRELKLGRKTVRRWIKRQRFEPRQQPTKRRSKLDPFRGQIVQLLQQHPYTVPQLLRRLRADGYTGSYTILRVFARQVCPKQPPAFLTLHFAPGECAQVDCVQPSGIRSTRKSGGCHDLEPTKPTKGALLAVLAVRPPAIGRIFQA